MTVPVQPTTTNTHISDNFGKLLEPGLRKIFFETYAEVPEQFSKVYNVMSSTKAKETDYGLGAFGDWDERTSELAEVSYNTISPGLERTYTHTAYTNGFMVGRELYDDEQYNQINKMPKALARSGRAFVEKKAAETFIKAFNGTTGKIYDGKALLAKDHALLDSTAKGCNLVTGELNDANLKIALQCMRETVDEAGNLISAKAKKLVVPPALEFTAREILNSTQTAGTDLNNANSVKGALDLVVYDFIGAAAGGSDTHWFIIDPTLAQLNFFWRVKPEFKQGEEFDNFVSKYRAYMRFSYGVSDWRGIVGSEGKAASTSGSTSGGSGGGTQTGQ